MAVVTCPPRVPTSVAGVHSQPLAAILPRMFAARGSPSPSDPLPPLSSIAPHNMLLTTRASVGAALPRRASRSPWFPALTAVLVLSVAVRSGCQGVFFPDCPVYPGGSTGVPAALPDAPLPEPLASAVSAIRGFVQANVTAGVMAGAALEISYAGRTLISEGFGFADKDGSRPWLPNVTLQRIGSVTKVLPAHLLYQAHAAGRVHVHDAVAQTVSGFRPLNPFGGGGNITWHQLASQLSGLERAGPVGCLANNCTNAEALSHVQRRFLKWPPGTHPAYSNWAFGLLGNLLAEETLGASSFSDAVTTRIVKPLGLRSIGVDYTGDVWDRLAVGYLSGGVVAPFTDLGYAAPAGSAFSTVADLTLYGQTFLAAYFGDNDVSRAG